MTRAHNDSNAIFASGVGATAGSVFGNTVRARESGPFVIEGWNYCDSPGDTGRFRLTVNGTVRWPLPGPLSPSSLITPIPRFRLWLKKEDRIEITCSTSAGVGANHVIYLAVTPEILAADSCPCHQIDGPSCSD